MRIFRIISLSLLFSLLVYFSIYVLRKEETKSPSFDKQIIFINSGVGKEGYINAEGMQGITSLVVNGFIYDPPVTIKVGGMMMGNEDLFSVEGAVRAILTAKSVNNKEWEYSMTEYYLMKKMRERHQQLGKEAKKLLDREDAKFKSFKKITMDYRVKIGNNVLCLLRCYNTEEDYVIESLMLREIGGLLFQMKPRTSKEKLKTLYVVSSYSTGIYRPLIRGETQSNIVKELLRLD